MSSKLNKPPTKLQAYTHFTISNLFHSTHLSKITNHSKKKILIKVSQVISFDNPITLKLISQETTDIFTLFLSKIYIFYFIIQHDPSRQKQITNLATAHR